MSDIHFACPHCGRHLEIAEEAGNQRIECPACGKLITVPGEWQRAQPAGSSAPLLAGTSPGDNANAGVSGPREPGFRDLRPAIERNDTNGLSEAERIRDHIYDLFNQTAAVKRVDVLILKSPPFTSPPWVRVECWVRHPRDPALTLRSNAQLSVRPREFHRFPVEIDVLLSDDKQSRTYRSLIELTPFDAQGIFDYLLFERHSPRFGFRRCRRWPWQFWLPSNKPERLGVDPMGVLAAGLMVLGLLTIVFGIGALFLLTAGIVAYSNSKRRHHVLSAGKPAQEPRRLLRLDSWQTLVRELGADRDGVWSGIQRELDQAPEEGFQQGGERIWYWGVDGKEEREQLVVRFRRGIAFVHVYRYGKDLFVGWDAHVNCGTWVEEVSGGGYDKTTQELCSVHTITARWHVPNEYDITDTNCLLERVHAAVSKVVKLKLAERRIDQEIDFKILREPRHNLAGRQAEEPAGQAGGIQGVISTIRRLG